MSVINWIVANWSGVIEFALAVIGVASIIVKLTPTEADNKVLAKIVKFFDFFALTKKK